MNRSLSFVEGSSSSFLCGDENAMYCHLTTPKGKLIKFAGPCKMSINANTFFHEGIWLCSFSIRDFVTDFSANVEIRVIEGNNSALVILNC